MREIVLDTETTGLEADSHRIVEIGAVELLNALPTGRVYHQYINPQMPMPAEAFQIHGLGDAFLARHPVFSEIADAFADFIADARLVIHNATFDMAMINAEFRRLGRPPLPADRALDTLAIAKRKFPGAQASLDALCRRFGVDNSGREKHGALLDCELLAEVYLELMGGRQHGLTLDAGPRRAGPSRDAGPGRRRTRPAPLPARLTEADRAAHAEFVAEMEAQAKTPALWSGAGED